MSRLKSDDWISLKDSRHSLRQPSANVVGQRLICPLPMTWSFSLPTLSPSRSDSILTILCGSTSVINHLMSLARHSPHLTIQFPLPSPRTVLLLRSQ